MFPVGRMEYDSLPVSAFLMWTVSLSRALPLMRSAACPSPFLLLGRFRTSSATTAHMSAPHATIRPSALTRKSRQAPAAAKIVDVKAGMGKGVYRVHHGRVSSGLHGLRRRAWASARGCPAWLARKRKPHSRMCSTAAWPRSLPRPTCETTPSRAASSKAALSGVLRFCAGCAETSYARPSPSSSVTGYISNATGCSSIW